MSTPCSALCAKCVRPSFIFAIFASGSCGDFHSLFDVFLFFRDRSNRANSARVGFSTPDASANRRMNLVRFPRVPPLDASHRRVRFQRRRIDADRLPDDQTASDRRSRTHVKTASCVSTSINRRVHDSVE